MIHSDLHRPTVLCFGEILWDILPQGRFPGGAPLNVAAHLRRLGLRPLLISCVGRDPAGDELLRHLASSQLELSGITSNQNLPTGSVRATLSPAGDAEYAIAANTAWDHIDLNESVIRAASGAHALVFGSLAQRSAANLRALELLLEMVPVTAECVFDVNLRPPHDDLALVRTLATHATLLKLNAQEAAHLCADSPSPGLEETHARRLAADLGIASVCVTSGARGAGLLDQGQWFWEAAAPIEVRDTVGAGDAFLAGLLASRLRGLSTPVCLARACRLGEQAASRTGAMPQNGITRNAFRE